MSKKWWRRQRDNSQMDLIGAKFRSSSTVYDPHASFKVHLSGFPGCCSAGIISGLYDVDAKDLEKAEKEAAKNYGMVLATLSLHQMQEKKNLVLEKAGWVCVHQFFGKDYGGGQVFVYVKNLREGPIETSYTTDKHKRLPAVGEADTQEVIAPEYL